MVVAAIAIVYIPETIQPGVILGGLGAGFELVSPLFWIALIAGGGYLVREWLRARRAEAATPSAVVEVTGERGDR